MEDFTGGSRLRRSSSSGSLRRRNSYDSLGSSLGQGGLDSSFGQGGADDLRDSLDPTVNPHGRAFVHPGHQDEDVTGLCKGRGMINVLDIPRFSMEFHMNPAANLFQNGHGFYKPDQTDMWGGKGQTQTGEVGGRIAGSPDGKTFCCPAGSTWTVTKHKLFDDDDALRNIHCCSGRLPADRYKAFAAYKAGCFGGKFGSVVGRGHGMTGYASSYNTNGRSWNPFSRELDDSTNSADDGHDSVTPYTAEEAFEGAAADGADAVAADADADAAVGGEDALVDAPLEAAAAPAAEHLL